MFTLANKDLHIMSDRIYTGSYAEDCTYNATTGMSGLYGPQEASIAHIKASEKGGY